MERESYRNLYREVTVMLRLASARSFTKSLPSILGIPLFEGARGAPQARKLSELRAMFLLLLFIFLPLPAIIIANSCRLFTGAGDAKSPAIASV